MAAITKFFFYFTWQWKTVAFQCVLLSAHNLYIFTKNYCLSRRTHLFVFFIVRFFLWIKLTGDIFVTFWHCNLKWSKIEMFSFLMLRHFFVFGVFTETWVRTKAIIKNKIKIYAPNRLDHFFVLSPAVPKFLLNFNKDQKCKTHLRCACHLSNKEPKKIRLYTHINHI